MMNLICLLYISVFLTQLSAYPVDYNETTAQEIKDALNEFKTTITAQDYAKLLQDYNNEILPIDKKTHEEINSNYNSFSQHLLDIQKGANNINSNVTDCLNVLQILTADEYYTRYNDECNLPALSAGENIITVAVNKQQVVFSNKYDELWYNFSECMSIPDPAPKICVGVLQSTRLELQRSLPAIKANPVLTERKLKQQILLLSQCANRYTIALSQNLRIQFGIYNSCILDKINIASL